MMMDLTSLTQEKVDLIKQLSPDQIEALLRGCSEKDKNIAEVREFLNRFVDGCMNNLNIKDKFVMPGVFSIGPIGVCCKDQYKKDMSLQLSITNGDGSVNTLANILAKYPEIKVVIVDGAINDRCVSIPIVKIHKDFVADEKNIRFTEIFEGKSHPDYPNLIIYDKNDYYHWCGIYDKIKDRMQSTL